MRTVIDPLKLGTRDQVPGFTSYQGTRAGWGNAQAGAQPLSGQPHRGAPDSFVGKEKHTLLAQAGGQ